MKLISGKKVCTIGQRCRTDVGILKDQTKEWTSILMIFFTLKKVSIV
jgi:hypothetical protein